MLDGEKYFKKAERRLASDCNELLGCRRCFGSHKPTLKRNLLGGISFQCSCSYCFYETLSYGNYDDAKREWQEFNKTN